MSSEDNKAIVRKIFEVALPSRDLAGIEHLVAESYVDHDPVVADRAHGLDSMRATHAYLHARGEPVRFDLEEVIGEGDQVSVRWSFGSMRAIAWFRLAQGRVTERWALLAPKRA